VERKIDLCIVKFRTILIFIVLMVNFTRHSDVEVDDGNFQEILIYFYIVYKMMVNFTTIQVLCC